MDQKTIHQTIRSNCELVRKIALGRSDEQVLADICLAIEAEFKDKFAFCSILELIGDQLYHTSAPNLPADYCDAIDGVQIGPSVGSCGTAAFNKQRVVVDNIQTSELWQDYLDIIKPTPLKACVSQPILNIDNKIIGTVAIYFSEVGRPSEEAFALLDYFERLTSVALERISKQTKMESLVDTLTKSNQKFRAFTKVMPDLALILDEEGRYEDVHGSPDNIIYLSATEIINKKISDLFPEEEAEKFLSVISKTLETNQIQVYEYTITNPEDQSETIFEGRVTPIHFDDEFDRARHVLWMARDITKEKSIAEKIEQLAYYDPLTNLPNRRMFSERLKLAVESNRVTSAFGAILFLDLDKFKRINDSLGHQAGDMLLVDVSERLKKTLRRSDILARIGGDEFVLLLEHIGDSEQESVDEVGLVAKKIQDAFVEKFTIDKLAFQVSCSIGISFIDGSISSDDILKFADTAMYNAKTKGGNSFSFYDPHQQTLLNRQVNFESEIVEAIDKKQFCAYFQPQVDLTGKITGAEALIRWKHPKRGLVAPYEFIPVAEQYSLIQNLQNVVLEEICELLGKMIGNNELPADFKISINISHSQFKSAGFKKSLLDILEKHCISPTFITLEITESMLAHDINNTVEQMQEIAELGFTFSIDDFGTGYSSLAHLHAFPVAELKIDKSFVDRMLQPSGLSIVDTIATLAKNLKMKVVAEGVEDVNQVELLKEHHIDILQGYLISKPMPLDEFIEWHRCCQGEIKLSNQQAC